MPDLAPPKLLISVKEARKLIGSSSKVLTNDELTQLILDYQQLARLAIRQYLVRK